MTSAAIMALLRGPAVNVFPSHVSPVANLAHEMQLRLADANDLTANERLRKLRMCQFTKINQTLHVKKE